MEATSLLSVGSQAPDFSAPATTGEEITLAQFRGKHPVVLSFYPRDFSWGCTRQLCSYRDGFQEILRRNAIVLGVSRNSPQSQARFAAQHHLPFPLLSDADGAIARRYGAARLRGLLPLLRRITFVIDNVGVIRGIIRHELAVDRHRTEMLKILETVAAEGERVEGD